MSKTKVNRIAKPLQYSPFSDIDRDGVPNVLDCNPTNPMEQGLWDWVRARVVTPVYQRIYRPAISRVRPAVITTRRTIRQYVPTAARRTAARRYIERKPVEVVKKLKKRIPERKELARFAIKRTPLGLVSKQLIKKLPEFKKIKPEERVVISRIPKIVPGRMGLLAGAEAVTPVLREKVITPIRRGYEKIKGVGVYSTTFGYIKPSKISKPPAVPSKEPPKLKDILFEPTKVHFGIHGKLFKKGEEVYHRKIVEPVGLWIGGEKTKARGEQEVRIGEAVKKIGELERKEWMQPSGELVLPRILKSEVYKTEGEVKKLEKFALDKGWQDVTGRIVYPDTVEGKDWVKTYETKIKEHEKYITPEGYYKEEYLEYTPEAKSYVEAVTSYEKEKAKLGELPKAARTRRFIRGAGEVVAGIPGFVAFTAPRVISETIVAPKAAPSKAVMFGKEFYGFAKVEPYRAAGGLAVMAAIPLARKLPVKPKISVGRFPKGTVYSFGIETVRHPGFLKRGGYGGFHPLVSISKVKTGMVKKLATPEQFAKQLVKKGELKSVKYDVRLIGKDIAGYLERKKVFGKREAKIGISPRVITGGLERRMGKWVAKEPSPEVKGMWEMQKEFLEDIYGHRLKTPKHISEEQLFIQQTAPIKTEVLFHELTHLKHPKWHEMKVLGKEIEFAFGKQKTPFFIKKPLHKYRFSLGEPKIKGEIFGKEPYAPTTPLETYLAVKAIPKEALKITEARGVRYYTIKSGVKPKRLEPIIDETLRYHGLSKSTEAVIKILRKEKADLYGSVVQKVAGREVGKVGLARVPRDFDVRVLFQKLFAKRVVEMINKAEGREVVILKKGKNVVVKSTGEKLFDIHPKEKTPYAMFGEDYLAYGLKGEPIIKTIERIRTTTLSEQATRKLHGAMRITEKERVFRIGKEPSVFETFGGKRYTSQLKSKLLEGHPKGDRSIISGGTDRLQFHHIVKTGKGEAGVQLTYNEHVALHAAMGHLGKAIGSDTLFYKLFKERKSLTPKEVQNILKYAKSKQVHNEINYILKELKAREGVAEGFVVKGRIAPAHKGRVKDISDYYFAEKANIEGLRLKGRLVSASKADVHLEKWLESWGKDVKKYTKDLYTETVRKEGGTKAWLGTFEEKPFSPSESYKMVSQIKYVSPVSVTPPVGIVAYQIPSVISEISVRPSVIPSAIPPSVIPSVIPSKIPTAIPSKLPSVIPTRPSVIGKIPSGSRVLSGIDSKITSIFDGYRQRPYKPKVYKPYVPLVTGKPYKSKPGIYKPKVYKPKTYKPYSYKPYPYTPYTPPSEGKYPFIPFVYVPPPPVTKPHIIPKDEEEIKKLRREPWAAIQTTVKNPILSADQLIKKML